MIYEEDLLKYKIPTDNGLQPVNKNEIEVLYNVYHGAATIATLGFIPPPSFYYAVILNDIICVDENGIEEYFTD